MHFDVPKVVRSPGCDHGHDEESRNGRDIKIDILEAYVWTSEVFRVKSGFFRSTGRLPEPPGNLMGLSGPRWKRGEEGRLAGQGGEAQESPTPSGSRIPPPILVQLGFLGGEKRRRGPATSPSPNRTRGRGEARSPLGLPLSPFH